VPRVVGDGKGSLFWPIFCTLMLTVGELYLSPIGLSLVTKVSPVRIVSMMMGMWFVSSFFGNIALGLYRHLLHDDVERHVLRDADGARRHCGPVDFRDEEASSQSHAWRE
jgi:dipeptide/tripeptide permease